MPDKDILSPPCEQTPSPINPEEPQNEGQNGGEGEAVSLGKFKDIHSLLKAYDCLQSEFTRKCQRLAELEKRIGSADNEPSPAPPERLLEDSEFVERYVLSNREIADRVLENYLRELIKSQAPATSSFARGMMPVAPPAKPKSIYEAGKLAEKMFKNP